MNDKSQQKFQVIEGNRAKLEVDLLHKLILSEINVEDFKAAVAPKGKLKLMPTQSIESNLD